MLLFIINEVIILYFVQYLVVTDKQQSETIWVRKCYLDFARA